MTIQNPTVTPSIKKVGPNLRDVLDLMKKDILLSLNCHAIATVQSFDPSVQTVTATINYKKSITTTDENGIYKTSYIDYPLLLDVPVVILGGGQAQITFPIAAGDTCLILFNDRDIDNWFQSGQVGPLASSRLHSFADGIALVGLRASSAPLEDYDITRAKLAWGETMVGVSASKVKIANTLYTLNGLLQELITQIELITVVCAAPGNASSIPANAAAIAAVATKIGELLE